MQGQSQRQRQIEIGDEILIYVSIGKVIVIDIDIGRMIEVELAIVITKVVGIDINRSINDRHTNGER